ncbi:MAG: hypothetical protein M1497_11920 [Nitrospirae bacterium]|nr:hypothetical protein [Nitrospirota bacterium]
MKGSEAIDFSDLDRAGMFDALLEAVRALSLSVSDDMLEKLIREVLDRFRGLLAEREVFFSYELPSIADSFVHKYGIYGNILTEEERDFVRGFISGSGQWYVSEKDLNRLSFLVLLSAIVYRAKIEAHLAGNAGVHDMIMQEQILVNSLLDRDGGQRVDRNDLAGVARIVVDPGTGRAYPDIESALMGYGNALSVKGPLPSEAVVGAFTMHTLRSLERIVTKEFGPEEYAKRDPVPDLLKTDTGSLYESKRPAIREKDALNTYKDNEDYTYFKDSDGVYRKEDVGYEGQIAVTVENGFKRIPFGHRSACIVRLAKSFASVLAEEARFAGPARVEITVLQSLEPMPDIKPDGWERHANTNCGLIIDMQLTEGSRTRVHASVTEDLLDAQLGRGDQRRIIAETLSSPAVTRGKLEPEEKEAPSASRGRARRPVRVLFLDSPFTGAKMPLKMSSASLFLGTALKNTGIEVDISSFEFNGTDTEYQQGLIVSEERLKKTLGRGYDVVAFGFSADVGLHRIRDFMEIVRAGTDALIAVGGPMPTLFPEHMIAHLPYVNILIRGEAEEAFPRVLAALSLSRDLTLADEVKEELSAVKGAWISREDAYWINGLNYRNTITDLDTLDIDFGLIKSQDITLALDEGPLKILGLVFGRGCPKACAFCSHTLTKKVRAMSVDKMITMVLQCQWAVAADEIPLYFYPQDDDFFIRPGLAVEFIEKCSDLKNRGILKIDFASLQVSLESLITEKDGRRLPNNDLLDRLERCRNIFVQDMPHLVIGTDSFTNRGLVQLKKGRVGHPYTVAEIDMVVAALEQRGMRNEHFVIMGDPGSEDADVALCCHVIASFYDRYDFFGIKETIPGIIPDPSLPVVKSLQEEQRDIEKRLTSTFLTIEKFPEFAFFEKGFIIPPGLDFFSLSGMQMQNLSAGPDKERFRNMAHAFWKREIRGKKMSLSLVIISKDANRARSYKSKLSRSGFRSIKTFRTIKEALPDSKGGSEKLILNLDSEERGKVPAVLADNVISYFVEGPKEGTAPVEISDVTNILHDWIIDHLIVPQLAEEHTTGIKELLYRRWQSRSESRRFI